MRGAGREGDVRAGAAGEIAGFTGIDDPYEAPEAPELTLDTVACSAEANAGRIMGWLAERGWVR